MARETEQRLGERDPAQHLRALGIESRLADPLLVDDAALPPLQRPRECTRLQLPDAERLPDVADGTAAAVSDDCRGQGRALARIFAIDVLNDLFAPLVLEIHVDVRRLVAFLRDEPLDERLHAAWIDLGNAQTEAHHGIRSRTPALAQDPDAAGVAHDVVHGQEIRLVAQLGDQLELMLDELAHFRRLACRPPPPAAALRQRPQVAGRSLALRDQLVRILVTQLRQREIDALEYRERLVQQFGGITPDELRLGPQAALAVRMQLETEFVERNFASNRR